MNDLIVFRDLFIITNTSHSDFVTKQEFSNLIRGFIKAKKVNQKDIMLLFDSYDRDRDGHLCYREFFNVFAPFNKEYRANLRRKAGIKGAEGPMGDGTRGFDKDSSVDRFYGRERSPKRQRASASISGKGTWGMNKNR